MSLGPVTLYPKTHSPLHVESLVRDDFAVVTALRFDKGVVEAWDAHIIDPIADLYTAYRSNTDQLMPDTVLDEQIKAVIQARNANPNYFRFGGVASFVITQAKSAEENADTPPRLHTNLYAAYAGNLAVAALQPSHVKNGSPRVIYTGTSQSFQQLADTIGSEREPTPVPAGEVNIFAGPSKALTETYVRTVNPKSPKGTLTAFVGLHLA